MRKRECEVTVNGQMHCLEAHLTCTQYNSFLSRHMNNILYIQCTVECINSPSVITLSYR